MKSLPYYRMWVKDFDTDEKIILMSRAQRGLYLDALNYAWTNNGLPANEEDIGRALRMTVSEFKQDWPAVSTCFVISADGRRRNSRQEEEREHAMKKSKQASDAVSEREKKRHSSIIVRSSSDASSDVSSVPSDDHLRAYDSDSVSESNKKIELPCVSEFPATMAAIRKRDPAIDETFVRGLYHRVIQYCLSSKEFPQEMLEKITDKVVAKAVNKSFDTGPRNHKNGLLLNRVPSILVSWAVQDKQEEMKKNGQPR